MAHSDTPGSGQPKAISFGRGKNTDETPQDRSRRYRREILTFIHDAGAGHTGGSLSCIDILNVLYNSIMDISPENWTSPDRDFYVQSKGHSVEALYVVLADRGFIPREEMHTGGAYKSRLIGHPTRKVPGVEHNTGGLGHGLSVAVGLALSAKLDRHLSRVFCLLGDGELAEGSCWEAAMTGAHYRLDNLVVVVDRNRLQITGPTEEVLGLEPLTEKWRAFGWEVTEVDGHETAALEQVFRRVPFSAGRPNLVIAHTVKGKGVSFIEGQADWHHHVTTSEQYVAAMIELGGKIDAFSKSAVIPELDGDSGRNPETYPASTFPGGVGRPNLEIFAETVEELACEDRSLYVTTSDSRGSGRLSGFASRYPERMVEVGIAEQNLVGIAAGLAAAGKKVVAVSPASFLTTRSLEQIKHDICYSDRPVVLVGISAGVSYGALGSTHHSLHDFAALRAIHNITIVAPADNYEALEAVRAALTSATPVYIRFGKKPLPHLPRVAEWSRTSNLPSEGSFRLGKGSIVRTGTDCLFIATGETVWRALAAAVTLESSGISAGVISMHTVKPLDEELVIAAAESVRAVVVAEEHSVYGGLGDACAAVLMKGLSREERPVFHVAALPDEETVTGSQEEILNHYGVSPTGLHDTMLGLLNRYD